MEPTPTGAVVVGLDPSAHARAALHWAAEEAATRDSVLRIGHAWMLSSYDFPDPRPLFRSDRARQAAQRFLDDAAKEVRATHQGLKTETVLIDVNPIDGLLELAGESDLLVVGRRGMNSFLTFLLGSVSQSVVAESPVPTVVVPRDHTPAAEAPVVVGVAPGVPGPVEFAFAEAARRDVRLEVVRSWSHPDSVSGTISAPLADELRRGVEESAELEQLLAPAREAHPRVDVVVRTRLALAEKALVDASARACLVVVGAHRRHSRYGQPIGRVAHRVLHLSRAPVAVVPNG